MIETTIGHRRAVSVPCTVEVEHTFASLHAHVELDDGVAIGPGDEVLVHGAPETVPFGEKLKVRCHATVVRASWLERLWTKITAQLELTELYEVSFTPRRTL